MQLKKAFSYVRVSTARQGHRGTSLTEQRRAILLFAQRNNLKIIREFQELETAAKRGRPVFREMMTALHNGEASGLVMHKIDRGARNLKDWADIGELMDTGIEVMFANENLDMYSRGGRLSADIQAVVAADYIRNLREEVKKGIYGRIQQGLYPMPAPVGYLNRGAGKTKGVDPATATKVRDLFELYSTGKYSLKTLALHARSIGLQGRFGKGLSAAGLASILHNPFYTGIIYIKIRGEYFPGRHTPIVPKPLFDRVQGMTRGKISKKPKKIRPSHPFIFSRLIRCEACHYSLVGEKQKGHIYYRCHTFDCPEMPVKENEIFRAVVSLLKSLDLNQARMAEVRSWLADRRRKQEEYLTEEKQILRTKLKRVQIALNELDGEINKDVLDRYLYLRRKNGLVAEKVELKQELKSIEFSDTDSLIQLEEALEFIPGAYFTFMNAPILIKRKVIDRIAKFFTAHDRTVVIKLRNAYELIATKSGGST